MEGGKSEKEGKRVTDEYGSYGMRGGVVSVGGTSGRRDGMVHLDG